MDAKQILNDALDLLLDEHDEDPRNPTVIKLKKLIDASDDMPTGEIELTATLKPNGFHHVCDQNGRTVKGVKSVAVFQDQSGQTVFQVNL
ncbi:hypothetical protein [Vibrio casei]|uniref:Uncharacterized protein n=1 Tax=Vibrio casei TaxID=673372 RepID=A0A368LIH8_9VIBR|nr:hypothetical protein [Vibrio casei]RCS70173.1 hypothetical protein CIK83_11965 [Vibrio casei]SJN24433.1 hypothetical protein FM109_05485 [Vibrio casei]